MKRIMKRGFLKKIWLIFTWILLLNLVFFPFLARAGEEIKLFVSPEMFELEVERGEILEDKIKIYNKSEVAVPIEVSVTNFGSQEETGTITFYEEPVSKKSVEVRLPQEEEDVSYNPRKWIKIENPNFILDPGETEEIGLKINIPENAEPGGHYAVAIFEPKFPSYYFEEEALKVIPKIGVLFLFSVKVEGLMRTEEPLAIVEFNIPERFHLKKLENLLANISGIFSEAQAAEKEIFSIVETSHLPFTLRIKNNDIYHIKPEGKLVIFENNGKIVGETEIQKTTILPGRIRKFPVEFKPDLAEKLEKYLPAVISDFISKNLLFGKYRAHLFLTVEDGVIKKDIEFWAFPWKITLFIFFISFLLLFVLLKYRKRIKSAIKVLVRR